MDDQWSHVYRQRHSPWVRFDTFIVFYFQSVDLGIMALVFEEEWIG
jgi:hypothetical protein